MKTKYHILLIVLVVSVYAVGCATTQADFSGKWKLDRASLPPDVQPTVDFDSWLRLERDHHYFLDEKLGEGIWSKAGDRIILHPTKRWKPMERFLSGKWEVGDTPLDVEFKIISNDEIDLSNHRGTVVLRFRRVK